MWRGLISLAWQARAFLRGDAFHGALESSRIEGRSVVVSGWVFSRRGAIARVEVWLDGTLLGPARYAVPRPDVVETFPWTAVGAPGYEARLPIDPEWTGPRSLVVRVVDARENVREYRRTLGREGPLTVEIERAVMRGDTLDVEGWALWPSATAPIMAEVAVNGVVVATTTVGLSRPDVAERFRDIGDAWRSGFRVAATLDARAASAVSAGLRIEFTDAHHQRDGRAVRIRSERSVSVASAALARLDAIVDRHDVVLDWTGGGELAARWPHRTVFAPPAWAAARLPYADATVEVVILATRDPARLAEARRVASSAVVVADAASVDTLWSDPRPPASSPRVSIVIPVYGQVHHTEACLARLRETLPADIDAEIVVVDDASSDDTPAALSRWSASEPRLRVLTNAANVGFVESVNRGARAATGDVLVVLNNDTLPRPGWLPPLLALLRDDTVGAVGAKLVYPDGRLQEAGATVFADGSASNFGRGSAEPDTPLFDHVREVDYCSGAVLATPRAVFLGAGGFDARYAPAYYEDVDYAFTLRARGYRVLYQPASVVVHVEGATAGVDPARGVKRYQAENRAKFVERWRDVLASRPAPPDRMDDRVLHRLAVREPSAPRALVWAPILPTYDREGGSRRLLQQLEFLRAAGWAVSFVAESAAGGERYRTLLRQMGVAVYAGRDTRGAGAEYLHDPAGLIAAGGFDLVIVQFWDTAERHVPDIRRYAPSARVIVDSVDLHFLRQARQRRHRGEPLDGAYADGFARELNVYAAADVVLTVSEKEARLVDDLVGRPLAHVFDTEAMAASTIPYAERRGIVFLGNFGHPPNIEALSYFVREILPRLPRELLAEHPVSVIGNGLDAAMVDACRTAGAAVRWIGWVPSVEPYLHRARVTVVPLQHGAGVKRKLIQALMAGTPTVSTSIGVEGLDVRDGVHVLIGDDPATFARHVVRAIEDREHWERLAFAGREAMQAVYAPDVVAARFAAVLSALSLKSPRAVS